MEVTKENFEVVLPLFKKALSSCDFFTFDLEMTGINLPPGEEIPSTVKPVTGCRVTDPVESCIFPNKEAAARRYNIVQLGVSLFTRQMATACSAEVTGSSLSSSPSSNVRPVVFEDDDDDDEAVTNGGAARAASPNTAADTDDASSPASPPAAATKAYAVQSFNFYVFPSTTTSRDVCMNAETVAGFLTQHGMDFTKWISHGIPYVTVEEATKARNDVKHHSSLAEIELMASKDKVLDAFLRRAKKLAKWRTEGEFMEMPFFPQQKAFDAAMEALSLLGLKRYQVEVDGKRKFRATVDLESAPGSHAEAAKAAKEKTLGALRLYEALTSSGKPVIAHNCMSDLLFLYYAFNDTPLKDYADFKKKMHGMFPLLYDTRTLVTLPELGFDPEIVQNLQGQYKYFANRHKKLFEFNFPLGFEQFHPAMLAQGGHGAHEAAYDAYMTGVLFLCLQERIGGPTAVLQHANEVAVYGSVITSHLTGPDKILHDAQILMITFGEQNLGATRVDQSLKGTGLQGRVMSTHGAAVIFCETFVSSSELPSKVEKALKNVAKQSGEGTSIKVIFHPEAEKGKKKM